MKFKKYKKFVQELSMPTHDFCLSIVESTEHCYRITNECNPSQTMIIKRQEITKDADKSVWFGCMQFNEGQITPYTIFHAYQNVFESLRGFLSEKSPTSFQLIIYRKDGLAQSFYNQLFEGAKKMFSDKIPYTLEPMLKDKYIQMSFNLIEESEE